MMTRAGHWTQLGGMSWASPAATCNCSQECLTKLQQQQQQQQQQQRQQPRTQPQPQPQQPQQFTIFKNKALQKQKHDQANQATACAAASLYIGSLLRRCTALLDAMVAIVRKPQREV